MDQDSENSQPLPEQDVVSANRVKEIQDSLRSRTPTTAQAAAIDAEEEKRTLPRRTFLTGLIGILGGLGIGGLFIAAQKQGETLQAAQARPDAPTPLPFSAHQAEQLPNLNSHQQVWVNVAGPTNTPTPIGTPAALITPSAPSFDTPTPAPPQSQALPTFTPEAASPTPSLVAEPNVTFSKNPPGAYVGPASLNPKDLAQLSPEDQQKYEKLKTPTIKP